MYRARVFHDGVQHSLGSFFTISDAKAALALARADIARRQFVPPAEAKRLRMDAAARAKLDALTVGQWSKRWLDGLQTEGRSPGTIRSYASTLNRHVLPTLADTPLTAITPDDIDLLLARVPSRGARTNTARTLRAMLLAAVRDRTTALTVSPFQASITKPRVAAEIDPDDIATAEEVRRLAAAMPERLRIGVELAAWGCLRQGELLGLQRRDIDLDAGAITIRRQWLSKATPPEYAPPKAGSTRRVHLPASLLPALRDHLDRFTPDGPEAPLLPSPRDPRRPVSQTNLDMAWRKARAGVRPSMRFHDLRHVGLTHFARTGATIAELQARGGHRDASVALRYQHATAERDRALTDKLNAAIEGRE